MNNQEQLLFSLLSSIQIDQVFKSHLKDPHILIQVCQLLLQKYPQQSNDIHILMDINNIPSHIPHKNIPSYVILKINTISNICDNLQIPFPLYSLQSNEFTSPLLLTEAYFNENKLKYNNIRSYDYSVGIDIGKSNASISIYHSLTGEIEKIPNQQNNLYEIPIHGLTYIQILTQLKEYAEKYLNHPILKVFVCLPMDATIIDRLKLRHAAILCHLELLGTSNSPQLTAFSYGANVQFEHSVVICDIGAKSIDIGYFLIEDGFVEVKSIFFNDSLGANSIDNLLLHHYQKELSARFLTLLPDDPFSNSHLLKLCQNLKIHLSTHESGEMICDSILNTLHYQKTITKNEFEDICQPYFLHCTNWLSKVFNEHFPLQQVDEILLIGGGSNIPQFKSIFQPYLKASSTSTTPSSINNNNIGNNIREVKIVSDLYNGVKGAALLSALRSNLISSDNEITNSLLVDVTTHDISLVIENGLQSVIATRCTSIPLVKSQLYTTTYDNQTTVLIHIVETIREDEEEEKGIHRSTTLGWFLLENLPERPKGEVKISVIIDISSIYEVTITATVVETGASKTIIIALNQHDEASLVPNYFNLSKLYLEHCPNHHNSSSDDNNL